MQDHDQIQPYSTPSMITESALQVHMGVLKCSFRKRNPSQIWCLFCWPRFLRNYYVCPEIFFQLPSLEVYDTTQPFWDQFHYKISFHFWYNSFMKSHFTFINQRFRRQSNLSNISWMYRKNTIKLYKFFRPIVQHE